MFFLLPAVLAFFFGLVSQNEFWNKGFTYFDYFAPLILPTILIFISTQIVILRIAGERAPYGTLDRDILALPRTSLYIGKFLSWGIVASLQAVVIFLISFFLFQVRTTGNPMLVLIVLILIGLFGVSLGLFFSVICSTREQAIQLVPFTLLGLFILNPKIINFDTLTPIFKTILENVPLNIAERSLNKIMVYGQGISQTNTEIITLFLWIVIFVIFGIVKFLFESPNKSSEGRKIFWKFFTALLLIIVLGFSFKMFLKPTWDSFQVHDFGIEDTADKYGTYPYIHKLSPIVSIVKRHFSHLPIKDSVEYVWNVQGEQLEAIALIMETSDETYFENLGSEGTLVSTSIINNEEVSSFSKKVKNQEIKFYVWDEKRFLFVLAGPEDFSNHIISDIVSTYPSDPTPNRIKITTGDVKKLFSEYLTT
jgi:ABC-type multidrug transport system permease subunit